MLKTNYDNTNTKVTKLETKGITIAFLGPDGSGKSTIISGLLKEKLPFSQSRYYHLKPLAQKNKETNTVVEDPHGLPVYGTMKSLLKLLFFIFQYNWGWFKNILPLKRKSTLIIFDRYFDDLLVDHKRYRYGGSKKIATFIRQFICRPELYFILTTDALTIHHRKNEVPFEELQRQILGYKNLVDNKRYLSIDVSRNPEEIIKEITLLLIDRVNGVS